MKHLHVMRYNPQYNQFREKGERLPAGYGDDVQALSLRARALILDVFPTAIEMVDGPARLIGYGTDRIYKGRYADLPYSEVMSI
jgi:hypothetical protein